MTPYFKLRVESRDLNGGKLVEDMAFVNMPQIFSTDTTVQKAAATNIENFTRGVVALTTNSYTNTELLATFSTGEILAE